MRKLIALFLIPVFLFMTGGVTITSLYCNGKISDVGLSVKACCKDVDKGGCCDTKTKTVKVEDGFLGHSITFDFNKLIDFTLSGFQTSCISKLSTVSIFKNHWDKAPPLISADLYLLHRSLII